MLFPEKPIILGGENSSGMRECASAREGTDVFQGPEASVFQVLIGLTCALLSTFAQTGPRNLDFHQGTIGGPPAEWSAPHGQGYVARITTECVNPGSRCVAIEPQGGGASGSGGNLMQSFSATAFRNQKVRLRASIRVVPGGSSLTGGCRAQM